MATFPPRPLVMVTWKDAHGSSTTSYAEEELPQLGKPKILWTIGCVCEDTEEGLLLFSEYSPEDKSWRAHRMIPRGMIIEVTPLAWPKVKHPKASKRAADPQPPPLETPPASSSAPSRSVD